MFPSLADFSREELVFICDAHDDAAFGLLVENHPATRKSEKFYDFLSGLKHPFANMIFGMVVPDPVETVRDITDRLAKSKAPAYWWVGPCIRPGNIDSLLKDSGWQMIESVPCMVIDLGKLESPQLDIELREVRTQSDLSDWQEVFAEGYEVPLEVARVLSPELDGPMRLFTAFMNGEPVGTTGLFNHLDVPGVYCVSTLPEHRRKGIGAAVTALPLLDAREQGYRIGTLQASSMGLPVYKRLGFEEFTSLKIFAINL